MIQIKNKYTQKIIHRGDFVTIKDCVEDAVQKGISLACANLENANLVCADLGNANLVGANLISASLANANLHRANLTDANLYRADLKGTNLAFANLACADLEDANLEDANLACVDLEDANLAGADLEDANLEGVNLLDADLAYANLTNAKMPDKPVILPPVGKTIIGFKKLANNIVIKVEIPADANRVSTWRNRKCRTSALRVIEVMQNPDNVLTDCMPGLHDPNFVYRLGELHHPDQFDPDERDDCRPGLHFFMTLEEAMNWE